MSTRIHADYYDATDISSAYRKPHTRRQRRVVSNSAVASSEPARTAAPRSRLALLAAVASVSAALIGVAASRLAGPWLARGEAAGAVDRVLTVDDRTPAVANLDPDLLRAL